MQHLIKRLAVKYRRDNDGHIAVIFALMALPLLAFSTFVIDYTSAEKSRAELSSALDDAALAAILDQSLTETERKSYAADFFWSLLGQTDNIELWVEEASATRVALKAHAKVPTSISAAVGIDEINVVETAVSELTKGDVVCMLALDPVSPGSFKVTRSAEFTAKGCSVQVNSIDPQGAVVNHAGTAIAKDFCMTGGAVGNYTPFANTDCAPVADPYKHRRIPKPGNCIDKVALDETLNDWRTHLYSDASGNYAKPSVTLQPGTYCGGLRLDRKNINFAPGTYIMKDGPLIFSYGTRADAEDVTFVFSGKESHLEIHDGGSLRFKAPETGDLAGLVFAQDVQKEFGKDAALPHAESLIRARGEIDIIGTAYLPTQKITFRGGSLSSAQAPATSFIAYQIEITEAAKIEVAVDHQAAGLPPLLPRSDEAARLVE